VRWSGFPVPTMALACAAVAGALGPAACGPDASPEVDTVVVTTAPPPGRRIAHTPGGLGVEIEVPRGGLSTGSNLVRVHMLDTAGASAPTSLDLVSPEMPMMGVRRVPLSGAAGSGDVPSARVDIPMAGLWEVYVNFGSGVEAARFEFRIEGSHAGHTSGPNPRHTGVGDAMDAAPTTSHPGGHAHRRAPDTDVGGPSFSPRKEVP